jgi:hypothetical protein
VAAPQPGTKGTPVNSQQDVRIDLTIVDGGSRRMESAPSGVHLGATWLNGWQVDRVDAPPGMFDGYDVYHIKINYELRLELGFPLMTWFEISFDFSSRGGESHTSINDALPRSGMGSDVPQPYALNQVLNFVPCSDGAWAHAILSASTDRIDAFGIGSQRVRWRHLATEGNSVRDGSYAAWVVLLVPAGQTEQRVEFSARFDLETDPANEYLPTQSPTAFQLPLADPSGAAGVLAPALSAPVEARDEDYHPSVFICYAHDSIAHKHYARQFGNLLVRNGVDAHMDQWCATWRKNWDDWAYQHIMKADFVIVLASPICQKAFEGGLEGTDNPGILSESRVIKEMLHTRRDEWTAKVLPVVLPNELVAHIPGRLHPWTEDHYEIDHLTVEGIDDLLRAMTGVPQHVRPPLGKMPRSVFKPLSGKES